jgi:hypothetical protein
VPAGAGGREGAGGCALSCLFARVFWGLQVVRRRFARGLKGVRFGVRFDVMVFIFHSL